MRVREKGGIVEGRNAEKEEGRDEGQKKVTTKERKEWVKYERVNRIINDGRKD